MQLVNFTRWWKYDDQISWCPCGMQKARQFSCERIRKLFPCDSDPGLIFPTFLHFVFSSEWDYFCFPSLYENKMKIKCFMDFIKSIIPRVIWWLSTTEGLCLITEGLWMSPILISARPLTGCHTISLLPNCRDMGLMDGLFGGWGTGCIQRVAISVSVSKWRSVTSSLSQGTGTGTFQYLH